MVTRGARFSSLLRQEHATPLTRSVRTGDGSGLVQLNQLRILLARTLVRVGIQLGGQGDRLRGRRTLLLLAVVQVPALCWTGTTLRTPLAARTEAQLVRGVSHSLSNI